MINIYLDLILEVIKKAVSCRYANGNDIKLINLCPPPLFSIFKLTTCSRKKLEDISHAHIVSSMYKLITTAKDTDALPIWFDVDRGRRRGWLTINKSEIVEYHVRIMLEDVFGFREHYERATYKLGYKLTLTKIRMVPFWTKLRESQMLEMKMTIFIGRDPIIQLLSHNTVYRLNRF